VTKFNSIELDRILFFISQGFSQKQIQEKLNLKKSTLHYRIKILEKEGYVTRIPRTKPAFFDLTTEGKTAIYRLQVQKLSDGLMESKVKVHNFKIYLPLRKDVSQGFWEKGKSWNVNNWIKSHRKIQHLGMTVEKTPKAIIVCLKPLSIRVEDIAGMVHNAVFSIAGYLQKNGIEVDTWGMRVSQQEYSVAQPIVKSLTDQGVTVHLDLGHPVQKIFEADPEKPAQAWIDASQGRPEIDTNDLRYAEDLVKMPRRIVEIVEMTRGSMSTLHSIANTQTYMAATVKILAGETAIIRKKVRTLDQRSVADFFRRSP